MPSYSKTNRPPRPARKSPVLKRANGQGSVYFNEKRQRWVAETYDVNGNRHKKFFRLQSDADVYRSDQVRYRSHGQSTYAPHPNMLVKEFLEQWLEIRTFEKHSTYRNYKSTINHRIIPHLGNQKAASLSVHAINLWLKTLNDLGYGAGTQKLAYRVLSSAYQYAVDMGDFHSNPVAKVKTPSGKSRVIRQIPRTHEEAIYRAAMNDPYMHARIEVGMIMGRRPSEVLGLKWSDLDLARKTLTLERQVVRKPGHGLVFDSTKTDDILVIPVTDAQIAILQKHQRHQELQKAGWITDEGLMFPSTIGTKLDDKRDRKWWCDLLTAANVPYYTRYQMRKTAFSNFAHVTDASTLRAYSGHKTVSTVMTYYAFESTVSMDMALNNVDQNRPKLVSVESPELLKLA